MNTSEISLSITVYIYGYVPQKAMNVFFCVVIMLVKLENGFTTPFIHKTEFPAVSQGVTVKTDHDYRTLGRFVKYYTKTAFDL